MGKEPLLKPILDVNPDRRQSQLKTWNPRSIGAIFLGAAILLACFLAISNLVGLIHQTPVARVLLPAVGALSILLVLPLALFISSQEDFDGLNPLWPPHYAFLLRKTVRALWTNNWKVSSKDF